MRRNSDLSATVAYLSGQDVQLAAQNGITLNSGASGLMGGGRAHEGTSESQYGIGDNITVNAGSISGHYTTDGDTANAALKNSFDVQKLSNQLQAQQMVSQLVGEVGGQAADKLNEMGVAGFGEKGIENSYGRIALENVGNALVAAITGGNVGATAASTAAGGLAVSASLGSVAQWAVEQTEGNRDTENGVEIHYVINKKTKKADNFKFKCGK